MQPDSTSTTLHAIGATSRFFRLGLDTQANLELVKVIDGLCVWCDDAAGANAQAVNALLGDLIGAQERGDVVRIADLLEFEVAPLLAA